MNQEQEKPKETPAKSTPQAPKKSSNIIWIVIIIIIVFLGLAGGGIYYGWKWWKNRTSTSVKSLTIPENCPKNIPIYPKSKIISITCKPEANSIESVIAVDSKTVKAWYKEAVEKKGWTIRSEDSASYLFDNDQEIAKVSLSTEKKNTAVKFLTAKRTASAPKGNTSSSLEQSTSNGLDIFDSLINWEDYFNSIPADYSSPTDEGTEFIYDESADSVDSGGSEEVAPEDTPPDTSTDTTPGDTVTDDGGNTTNGSGTDNGGWIDDKQYLQVPTD